MSRNHSGLTRKNWLATHLELDYGILSQVISGSCLEGVLKNTYQIIFSQLSRVKIIILMSPNLYRLS